MINIYNLCWKKNIIRDSIKDLKYDNGENIIHALSKKNKNVTLKNLTEFLDVTVFYDILIEKSDNQTNALYFLTKENKFETFRIIYNFLNKRENIETWKKLCTLNDIDDAGNNIILISIINYKDSDFDYKSNDQNPSILGILIDDLKSFDLDYQNKEFENILSLAIEKINNKEYLAKIFKGYKKNGIDSSINFNGINKNALSIAIEKDKIDIAQQLLRDFKANPLKILDDSDGATPLMKATLNRGKESFKIIKVILDSKPDLINKSLDKNENTLVMVASKDLEFMRNLLEYNLQIEELENKIDFNKKNRLGEDALYIALINNSVDIARLLLDQGVPIEEYLNDDRVIIDVASKGLKRTFSFIA